MPSPYIVKRTDEIEWLVDVLRGYHCIAVVGLSNMGKSILMRDLASEDVQRRYAERTGRKGLFIYVDCNSMVALTDQGFYELILRSIQYDNILLTLDPDLRAEIDEQYRRVIEPDTHFLVPLGFKNALMALIERTDLDVILLFDEFDEAFDALDGRVFLNLRALKDRYPNNLVYITASVRRLGSKRYDEQVAEFIELSARFTTILKPMQRDKADELAAALVQYAGLGQYNEQSVLDILWEQAGGHPGMLKALVNHIFEMEYLEHHDPSELGNLAEEFYHDLTILSECKRIWSQLGPTERDTLSKVVTGQLDGLSKRSLRDLGGWGLLRENDEGQMQIFSALLDDFVQRQAALQADTPEGIWVDVDSGDVWISGVPAPPLTELEFKLLQLLYERSNKVTDKYMIVERVWGVEYITEVDDSRIEKLVSRLRAKIEENSSDPEFLITIRGRGYKLIVA